MHLILKEQEINSTNQLITNEDGLVDVFIGPDTPKGKEPNWIKYLRESELVHVF
jgi:hypothetical protein